MVARPEPTAASAASRARSRRPPLLAPSYNAGAGVVRAFPPAFRHAVAAPGGTAWYWLNGSQRRAALHNHAPVPGPGSSAPRVARAARSALQNYGRMVLDFLLMGTLTREELMKRPDVDGLEHLDAALARGR